MSQNTHSSQDHIEHPEEQTIFWNVIPRLNKLIKTQIKHLFQPTEMNYKKKLENSPNMWRLNNMLLNNHWVNQRRNVFIT